MKTNKFEVYEVVIKVSRNPVLTSSLVKCNKYYEEDTILLSDTSKRQARKSPFPDMEWVRYYKKTIDRYTNEHINKHPPQKNEEQIQCTQKIILNNQVGLSEEFKSV